MVNCQTGCLIGPVSEWVQMVSYKEFNLVDVPKNKPRDVFTQSIHFVFQPWIEIA
jgi:hypothetical protein